jgi:tetratricopeptide (TPR) repeat protein
LEPKKARHNLRQCLLYIRQSLPGSETWLNHDGDRLRIDGAEIEIELASTAETPEPELLVMPRLTSVFSRMDEAARIAAVVAMTPAWIATGCHGEGLDEIEKLRRSEIGAGRSDLMLCEAEMQNAAYRVPDSIGALDEFEALGKPATPELEARYFLTRSHTLGRTYKNDEAVRYAFLAYQVARTLRDRTIAQRSLQIAASCLIEEEKYVDAHLVLDRAMRLADGEFESPWRSSFLHLCTRLALAEDDLPAASEASAQGVAMLGGENQPGIHGIVPARLGRYREALGDRNGAITLYERSKDLLIECECAQETAEVYTYLGDTYRTAGEYRKSLQNHEKAVSIRRSLRTPDALGTSLRGMGMAAHSLGDHRTAIAALGESAMLFEGCGRTIGKASALIPLARSYAAVNRFSEALPMFEFSLNFLDRELVGSRRLQLPMDLAAIDGLKAEFSQMASRRRPLAVARV